MLFTTWALCDRPEVVRWGAYEVTNIISSSVIIILHHHHHQPPPATTKQRADKYLQKKYKNNKLTSYSQNISYPYYINHTVFYYSSSLRIVKINLVFIFLRIILLSEALTGFVSHWSCFFSLSEVNFNKFQVHALLHLDELSLIKQIEINFHWNKILASWLNSAIIVPNV